MGKYRADVPSVMDTAKIVFHGGVKKQKRFVKEALSLRCFKGLLQGIAAKLNMILFVLLYGG